MEFNLDRDCPSCEKLSLIEHDSTSWKCMNPDCGKIFEEEYLDCGEE
jgi:ribosomal protein L37AE/L43A